MARTNTSSKPKASLPQEKRSPSLPLKPTLKKFKPKVQGFLQDVQIREPSPKKARTEKPKAVAKKGKSTSQAKPQSPSPSASVLIKAPKSKKKKQTKVREIVDPPSHLNNSKLQILDFDKFEKEFEDRSFCPVVSVNLQKLKEEFGDILSEVVKTFYCNMEVETTCRENGDILSEDL